MGEQNVSEVVIETGRVDSELYEDLVVRWSLERCPSSCELEHAPLLRCQWIGDCCGLPRLRRHRFAMESSAE